MLLARPEAMRAYYGAEEVANLTRLYMEAHAPDYSGDDNAPTRTEDDVLTAALLRASSRAASYLAVRFAVFGKAALPPDTVIPPVLVNAVCDIARYYLTGTPVQETEPIAERYRDALAWLREVAAGTADLPGFGADDDGTGEDTDGLVTGDVAFRSRPRMWSTDA